MPKDTFFNLSLEKKNKIIKAAKIEFTENPLRKSRVSNIIKTAKIPRGSFYQYFEDLDDLYYYVIDDVFKKTHDAGLELSDKTNDLFEFAMLTFNYDYDSFNNDMRHQFMMNVYSSISANEEYVDLFEQKRIDYIMMVMKKMDLSLIKHNNENDLIKIYKMIQELKGIVIRKSIIDKLGKEEAVKLFRWYMDTLKHGLQKEA